MDDVRRTPEDRPRFAWRWRWKEVERTGEHAGDGPTVSEEER